MNGNVLPRARKGCHIAHEFSPWIIGVCDRRSLVDSEEETLPDVLIDPDNNLFSLVNNSTTTYHSIYVTILGNNVTLLDKEDGQLEIGNARYEDGKIGSCITIIGVIAPNQVLDICYLEYNGNFNEIEIVSDVKVLHSFFVDETGLFNSKSASDWKTKAKLFQISFPLKGGEFLCSQGVGGQFTHFFPGTMYAVDIEAPVGTPLLAVADGEIVSIRHENCVSGIHVENLFKWNSIMLKLDLGVYVEYVHIQKGSVDKKIGDRVTEGEIVAYTGDVGFCPTPHLHIQMHESGDDDAPTVPFCFKAANGNLFIPEAGKFYSYDTGECECK